MFKKVLLPLDGSRSNSKIWDYAKEMIEKQDSKLEILYVNEDIWMDSEKTECSDGMCKTIDLFDKCDTNIVDINGPNKKKKEDTICQIKNQVINIFGEYHKNVTMKIVNGEAAYQIMSISKNQNFDVILLDSHETNAIKKLALGSVTHKVVGHSEVPVLVVR